MLFECLDRMIDLRRLIDIRDIQDNTTGSHVRMGGGMRLILDGLSAPYDITINSQNPAQATRLDVARRSLRRAWVGVPPSIAKRAPHVDDIYMWRGVRLDLADVVVVENPKRTERHDYGKTRKRGMSVHVSLKYAVVTVGATFVHAMAEFEMGDKIAAAGGMDFEHGQLLKAWATYQERLVRRAA